MTDNKTSNSVFEAYLLPASIFIAGVMIALTIFFTFGLNGVSFGADKTPVALSPLAQLAERIEVEAAAVEECIAEQDFSEEIRNDASQAQQSGISGTPGFVIGIYKDGNVEGSVLSGAQPFSAFQESVDSYLNGEGENDVQISTDDDPYLGQLENGKVVIVEFSDMECPFCQRFHQQTYKQIKSTYIDSGEVAYVYRDFPLSFHEPVASEAASAANCVAQIAGNEKYFEYVELYYDETISNGQGLP